MAQFLFLSKKHFSFFKKTAPLLRVKTLNFYEILGLDKSCTNEEIRTAYLKLAKLYHPDINKDPGADDKFKMIITAYEGLSTPKNRELYDAFIKNDPYYQEWKYKEEMYREETQDSAKNFYKERAKYDKYAENFYKYQSESNFWQGSKDDFENNFYKEYDNTFRGFYHKKQEKKHKAEDILLEISISLEDSFRGCQKAVKFKRVEKCRTCHGYKSAPGKRPSKCFTCNGLGEIKTSMFNAKKCSQCKGAGVIIKHPCKECDANGTKEYECEEVIPVPKGIRSHTNIRLEKRNGDLLVKVVIENDLAHVKRVRDDLHYTLEISLLDAIFGCVKEVNTWDSEGSKEQVVISPGVQVDEHIIFKHKGFYNPDLDKTELNRGNLVINLNVKIPSPEDFSNKGKMDLKNILTHVNI